MNVSRLDRDAVFNWQSQYGNTAPAVRACDLGVLK